MDARIWVYVLAIVGVVNLGLGLYFLTKDLKKERRYWQRSTLVMDGLFLFFFILEIGLAVILWVNFQSQILFFL
ncbi:hypothetical protein BW731_05035 [Vagococcus martis]|uniref:Uncharacterized protein n=1 Tax=Vagococcus martis TaxID=1768210 RepID=A0A1V4DGJ6_9ENTE|nr:hypothetical protein [Vagococcus martis]OPF87615.1 hypothetical protein BW731_05035 [Vagococcus martis]